MTRRLTLALTLTLALVLAGCGGDDGGSSDDGPATTEPAGTGATDDPAQGEDEGSEPGTTGTEGEEEGANGDDDPFCADFAAFDDAVTTLPDETLEDLQAAAATFADIGADLATRAPDAIADDVELLAGAFADLRDAVAGAETREDAEAAARDLTERSEVDEASQAVGEWVQENCST